MRKREPMRANTVFRALSVTLTIGMQWVASGLHGVYVGLQTGLQMAQRAVWLQVETLDVRIQ